MGLFNLPARLADAGDEPLTRELTKADAAHLEITHIPARAAADLAAIIPACWEFGRPLLLYD